MMHTAEMLPDTSLFLLVLGGVLVGNMLIKSAFEKTVVPPLIGWLAVGMLLGVLDDSTRFLNHEFDQVYDFLAKVGIFVLLFRVGLESDIKGLLSQLNRAGIAWVANILIAGAFGMWAAYLLGWSTPTALIIGTAFTATSVGVAAQVWSRRKALRTSLGALLVDLAELDDVTAVILMVLLFEVLPLLVAGNTADIVPVLPGVLLGLALKLAAFLFICYIFAHFFERSVTKFLRKVESPPSDMLSVAGVGLIIAAMAGLMGFSMAVGAFFAGLVFSADPDAVKLETSFLPLYEFFAPFFFIGVGMELAPSSMLAAGGAGALLLLFAVLGKLIANGVPVYYLCGSHAAWLLGFSMVPRAEIAMVVVQRCKSIAPSAVTDQVFGAVVVVCAATSLMTPIIIDGLLRRIPAEKLKL